MRAGLNQCLNVLWTILAFLPVLLLWWAKGISLLFWLLLILSLSIGFLPVNYFRLSQRRRFYEKWGVKWIRKWVQDGDFVKQRSEQVYGLDDLRKYAKRLNVNELFHWQALFFFLGTAAVGILQKEYLLVLATLVANYFYNFMAILLQQYNRLRLSKWL